VWVVDGEGRFAGSTPPPPLARAVVALARRVVAGGQPACEEAELDGSGEGPRAVRLSARPAGAGLVAVASLEVDALHEAENTLDRYDMVMQATHDAVWDWSPERGDSWWSRRQFEMFGYDPETTVPSYEAWQSRIHPDDRERVRRHFFDTVAAGASTYQDEYRFIRVDGSLGWALDRGYVQSGDDGRPRRVIGVMSDVTAERTALEALRASEERFREMTAAIDQVFWLSNSSLTETIYVSPAYETIWGRSCESVYQNPLSFIEAIHEDDRERTLASMPKQYEGTFDEVYRIRRPDGSIAWIRDRAFPIRDRDGQVIRIAGVATDITAQRRLEQQLAQAQRMESIGRLAGGIAHDFNNLLTVILSSVRLVIARLSSDAQVRADLDRIKEAGERAARLTRQLLLFARRTPLAPSQIDLNDLARQMERLLRPVMGEHIELRTALASELGAVMGDRAQLEQVLVNLAINARDAMPDGGRLTIETRNVTIGAHRTPGHPEVPPGDYVLLAVSDTGAGIPSESLPHIFEPFFTTKPAGQGTGLGLATCHGIIHQAGGAILVDTEVGRGTTFTILLPQVAERAQPAAPPPRARPGRGSETVLFVEDDPAVRQVGVRILAEQGYRVLAAGSGAEAIALAGTHPGPIHLLVTDVVMPNMSGTELARILLVLLPDLRVLYTSGHTDDTFAREVARPGAGFLPKPYVAETLLEMTRVVLDAPR
jgi:two-component system cell cycle sensor histidine kinase/response regulator CckA